MAKHKGLTVPLIAEALTLHRGNMSAAAESLGVTRQTIHQHVTESTDLQDLVDSLNETRIDFAESKLDEAVADREAWAVNLTLKTIGKRRGYVERTESTGADGGPHQVNVTVKREDRGPVSQ